MKLQYFDRYQNQILDDQVYADRFILFCYETKMGKFLLNHLFKKRFPNWLYGIYKNSSFSSKQIQRDIQEFKIAMDDYEPQIYHSYSDFFLRRFKQARREFPKSEANMGAFCEGRYLAFEQNNLELEFPVKGKFVTAQALLNNHPIHKEFLKGPIIIARLCPIDYHHFHFPDDGKLIDQFQIAGSFHSVNVHALRNENSVFIENERFVNILDTKNFGKIAYIEVGAMCVGKIKHEALSSSHHFSKGQLKGHFEFGASTVIILGEFGKWKPSADLLEHSQQNRESFIKLGDTIANKTF